jgi:hypothetical protein
MHGVKWVRGATAHAMLVDLVLPHVRIRPRGKLSLWVLWGREGANPRTRSAVLALSESSAHAHAAHVTGALRDAGAKLSTPSTWAIHGCAQVGVAGRVSRESQNVLDLVAPCRAVIVAGTLLDAVGDAARVMVHACEVDRGVARVGDLEPLASQLDFDEGAA